jgi:hypothetical protein
LNCIKKETAMIPGIDPKIDYAFKCVFGRERNRHVLEHMLQSVLRLPPERAIAELELPKFTRGAEELTDPLEAWVYFLRHGAELDTDALPTALRGGAIRDAVEELCMLSKNDLERERYEARMKVYRDALSLVRLGEYERTEGRAEGRAEGRIEGVLIGRIQLRQEMLQLPVTSTEDLSRLSTEELQRLDQQLAQQGQTDQK